MDDHAIYSNVVNVFDLNKEYCVIHMVVVLRQVIQALKLSQNSSCYTKTDLRYLG